METRQAIVLRTTFANFLWNPYPSSPSNLTYKIADIPTAMRVGMTIVKTIHIFLIGFCNMMKIRRTEMKVELIWTEETPTS